MQAEGWKFSHGLAGTAQAQTNRTDGLLSDRMPDSKYSSRNGRRWIGSAGDADPGDRSEVVTDADLRFTASSESQVHGFRRGSAIPVQAGSRCPPERTRH